MRPFVDFGLLTICYEIVHKVHIRTYMGKTIKRTINNNASWYILTLHRSRSTVKVIGQSSRSRNENISFRLLICTCEFRCFAFSCGRLYRQLVRTCWSSVEFALLTWSVRPRSLLSRLRYVHIQRWSLEKLRS